MEDLKEKCKRKQAAAKEAVEDKASDLKGNYDAQHSLQDKFDHLRTEAAHKLDDAKAKAAELKERGGYKI